MDHQPRRRRKPALSCVECRRRKIKCDRNDPCGHCVSAKVQCTYQTYRNDTVIRNQSQKARSGSWPSMSSPSTSAHESSILSPFRQMRTTGSLAEQSTQPLVSQNTAPRASDSSDYLGAVGVRPQARTQVVAPDFQDILLRVQRLEQSSTPGPRRASPESDRDILGRQPGVQDTKIILNKTRILRWSLWMARAPEYASLFDFYVEANGEASPQGSETGAVAAQITELLQKSKVLGKQLKVGRPSRSLLWPQFDLSPPIREIADEMMNLYFRSFEPIHRVFHEPTFRVEYQRYWSHPETITTDLRLKILLVIGIGSSLSEHRDPDAGFRIMVHQWIYAAQAWLSGPLEKDRLDISGLQIHCLTILARQIFSIGGDLVWMSVGTLIHSAMQIGLHRDPKHLPPMSILQAEIRRRLWATILETILQSSLDSALPPRISTDDFDAEPPSNNNDDEIDESTQELQPHPRSTYTHASLQLILLDSLPTRLRILQLLNGLHSEISYQDVLNLSSEITKAYRAYTTFTKENEQAGVTTFQVNFLDFLVRRFMIPLHCPFAINARANPLFHYSLKVSLDAAMAIISPIISPHTDDNFYRLMSIGGGLFREGFRCASQVITLELLAETEAQRLDGTLHRNSHYRELLKQAVRDMISLSLERIRQGETNIKMPVFLNMILTQVEATEAGLSTKLKTAESARDSLEFCYDLLKARLGSISLLGPSDTPNTSSSFDGGQESFGLDLDFDFDFFLPDAVFS